MKKNMISADALDDDLALEELPHGSDNKRKAFDHDSDDYGLDHDHDHSHSHGHKYDTHTKNAAQILTNPPAKKKKDHKKIIAEKNRQKAATAPASKFVALSSLSHAAQLDYMNHAMKKTFKNWTEIEFSSHTFQDEFIMDPAKLKMNPLHDLSNLNQFVKTVLPDWQQCLSASYNRQTGQPTLLILTISGQRAADIIRALPDMNRECKIMKLFAKHFKISEQADYLSHNVVRTAVGTPHRMSQLVAQGALDLSGTRTLILDVARDQKERNIFEYQDITKELLEFIHSHCFQYLASRNMQIIWY